MEIKNVKARVAKIADLSHDDERAHIEEDSLYLDVLKAIANGAYNAQALAMEAIKAEQIDFSRWCA